MKKILPIALIFWACTKNNDKIEPVKNIACVPLGARIHGGTQAKAEDFPFTVGLLIAFKHNTSGAVKQSTCTGSIVSENAVLTAAHCVSPTTGYALEKVFVQFAQSAYSQMKQGITVDAESVRIHEKYQINQEVQTQAEYDYAVLHLPVSLSFNAKIAPVLFKAKDEIPELFGKTAFSLVMLGWSNLMPKYDTAEPLLNAFNSQKPPLLDANEFVRAVIKRDVFLYTVVDNLNLTYEESITANRFSAMFEVKLKGRGTLPGDSGSPLLLKHFTGFYQIGVSSLYFPVDLVQNFVFLSKYTRLQVEQDWLFKNTGLQEAKIQFDAKTQNYVLDWHGTALEGFKTVEAVLVTGDCKTTSLAISQAESVIKTSIDEKLLAKAKQNNTHASVLFKFYYGGTYHNVVSYSFAL